MFNSLIYNQLARNATLEVEALEETGTVRKFAAYLGKSDTDSTIQVPADVSEYPSGQLAYFYTLDTNNPASPKIRATGSALNPLGLAQHGLPIWVGEHLRSRMLIIVGQNVNDPGFYTGAPNVGSPVAVAHGPQHYLFGTGEGALADPVFISNRQIREAMIAPTAPASLSIQFLSEQTLIVESDGTLAGRTTGQTLDLTASVPVGPNEARWVMLTANDTLAISATNGDVFVPGATVASDFATVNFGSLAIPASEWLIGLVYLEDSTTSIDWERIRQWARVGPGDALLRDWPNDLAAQPDLEVGYNRCLVGPIVNTGTFVNKGQMRII